MTTPNDDIVYAPFASGRPDAGPRRVCIIGQTLSSAATLYPGLSLGKRDRDAPLAALTVAGSHREAVRLSRQGRPVLRLRPGLLQTPRFVAAPPWLSATVVGGAKNGRSIPGAAEQALAAGIEPGLARRGAILADQIVAARIGGTCWAAPVELAGSGLIVVQACADDLLTSRMLDAVLARADANRVALVLRGPARGLAAVAAGRGCRVLTGPLDPWSLVDICAELHVADGSPIGFLALLAGRPVHCHASSWLAGWGLTTDAPDILPRARRSLTELAASGLLCGANYADPFTGCIATAEWAAELAAEWRRLGDANRGIASLTGMQFWKRRRLGEFLHNGETRPRFYRSATAAVTAAARAGGAVASWSSRMPRGLAASATAASVPVVRVEDGFVRSVGLGSNFLPPCSIILDRGGIYYDPAGASDLEHLLATASFGPALLERARRVIERLVQGRVTKYNVGTDHPVTLPALLPGDRRRVLVPGQVANDLSVRLGGAGIVDTHELLRRVREANPDAAIVYKPHPDVDAGHRPGAVPDAEILRLADAVVRDVSMAALIGAVDEVHTLTSLAGFEALLRGRKVVVWGQPFYAGWGLTDDMAPIPRRKRRLSVEQLTAGVLLLYPRYLDPVTFLPCPIEVLLDRLAEPRHWRPGLLARLRRLQGLGSRRLGVAWRALMRVSTPGEPA